MIVRYTEPIILTHQEFGDCLLESVYRNKAILRCFDTNKKLTYYFFDLNVNEPGSDFTCSPLSYPTYEVIETAMYKAGEEYGKSIKYKSEFDLAFYMKEYRGPITRALNIPFDNDVEKIDALAFLAASNPTIVARVYEGDSLDKFIQDYPDQPYSIDYCESSLIHATSFYIKIPASKDYLSIIPTKLKENIHKNTGKIYRTAFVQELVDNYGFVFGDYQNLDTILHKLKETYHYDLFVRKLVEYKDLINENHLIKTQPEVSDETLKFLDTIREQLENDDFER